MQILQQLLPVMVAIFTLQAQQPVPHMHDDAGRSLNAQQAHLRTRTLPHTDDAVLLWVEHLPDLAHGLQPGSTEVSRLWCN